MRNSCITTAAVVSIATALSGCTSPYSSPKIYSFDNEPVTIQGINTLLTDPSVQPDVKHPEVDLIAIHGMCTHDGDWALESINSLAVQLGEEPTPKKEQLTKVIVDESKAVVYKRQLHTTSGTVNIAAVVWSPVLTPLKTQLCYDQKNKTGLCERDDKKMPDFLTTPVESTEFKETRALGNRLGKDTMLDDCLVDAVAYQGKAREGISAQVQKALVAAATPGTINKQPTATLLTAAAERKVPLIIFTSSLGSKVGFDALNELSNKGKGSPEELAAGETFRRMKTVFMSANQIPLLQLADQTLDEANTANDKAKAANLVDGNGPAEAFGPKDSLSELLIRYQKVSLVGDGSLFVFLTDPNDILSYSLRNAPVKPGYGGQQYSPVDVVVSNAWTWFGLFENPKTAHTGYLDQPEIADIVVHGYKPPKESK